MESCAFTLLNTAFSVLLIIQSVEVHVIVSGVEHIVIIFLLEFGLWVVAAEARDTIRRTYHILIFFLLFLFRMVLFYVLAVDPLLWPTLQDFFESSQILDVTLNSKLLHVLFEILLDDRFGVWWRQRLLHQVIAIVSGAGAAWTHPYILAAICIDCLLLYFLRVRLLENIDYSIEYTVIALSGDRTLTLFYVLIFRLLNVFHRYHVYCLLFGLPILVHHRYDFGLGCAWRLQVAIGPTVVTQWTALTKALVATRTRVLWRLPRFQGERILFEWECVGSSSAVVGSRFTSLWLRNFDFLNTQTFILIRWSHQLIGTVCLLLHRTTMIHLLIYLSLSSCWGARPIDGALSTKLRLWSPL